MRPLHRILRGIAYGVPVCSLVLALFNVAGSKVHPARAGVAASAKPPALGRNVLTIVGLPWRGDGHGKGHHHRRATPTPVIAAPTSTATPTATSVATNTAVPGASATQPVLPSATATAANTITATPVIPPVTATLPASTVTTAPAATATQTSVVPINSPTTTQVPATATQVPATATVGVTVTGTPASAHGITTAWIFSFENHNRSQVIGSGSAPYINSLLRRSDAAQATAFFTPAGLHPSLGNYLTLAAGSCFSFCGTDNNPSPAIVAPHLTSLLQSAGISWRVYAGGISGTGCPTSNSGNYAVRHNPEPYFGDLQSNTAYCQAHVRPMSELADNVATARYNFIAPDLCSDMHSNSCAGNGDVVAQGDTWLAGTLPAILGSSAYQQGGMVVLWFDEGSGNSDGPLPFVILSPQARGGYSGGIAYNHASLLRTLEEIYGVSPMLGSAASATDLRDLFTSFP